MRKILFQVIARAIRINNLIDCQQCRKPSLQRALIESNAFEICACPLQIAYPISQYYDENNYDHARTIEAWPYLVLPNQI